MANSTSGECTDTSCTSVFKNIEEVFREADPVSLALILAFLVPFVASYFWKRDFGENKKKIESELNELKSKVIVEIAARNVGGNVLDFVSTIISESARILLPIKAGLATSTILGTVTLAAGMFITFYEVLQSVFPLSKGVWWIVFLILLIFSLLYLFYDYSYWKEMKRLDAKFRSSDPTRLFTVAQRQGHGDTANFETRTRS